MSNNPYTAPDSTLDFGATDFVSNVSVLPTVAKALAIISLCLGGFNIFGGICGIAGLSVATVVTNSQQIQKQMNSDDSKAAVEFRRTMADVQASMPMYIAQIALSILASIGLIVGGIGVLRKAEWGRRSLVYSCIFYVMVTLASWIWTIFATLKSMDAMDSAQRSGTIFGMVFGFAFGLIFLAFYIFTAVYLSKSRIRQYFQTQG